MAFARKLWLLSYARVCLCVYAERIVLIRFLCVFPLNGTHNRVAHLNATRILDESTLLFPCLLTYIAKHAAYASLTIQLQKPFSVFCLQRFCCCVNANSKWLHHMFHWKRCWCEKVEKPIWDSSRSAITRKLNAAKIKLRWIQIRGFKSMTWTMHGWSNFGVNADDLIVSLHSHILLPI